MTRQAPPRTPPRLPHPTLPWLDGMCDNTYIEEEARSGFGRTAPTAFPRDAPAGTR